MFILDHHSLGYISLWYGAATLMTGIILLINRKPISKYMRYIRLIHLLLGATTGLLGILTYLAAT
jgi:hypothetical protein